MFYSDSIFFAQTSDDDMKMIVKLNKRRSTFINKRFNITMQMVKGILDYNCLTKDKFLWRFETIANTDQQPIKKNDQEDISNTKPQTRDSFYTPEEMYNNMAYLTDNIVKDKIDEIYNEIVSRDFELQVKSMPYQNQKYIVQSLINQPFKTPQAELAWKQSVFDALTKNTGFLRTIIQDKNNSYKVANIRNKDGKYKLDWVKNTPNRELTTQIVSVDPETVFIDPATDNPQECFIISPIELHELKVKFPFLDKYIFDSDDLESNKLDYGKIENDYNLKKVFKEQPYAYHIGESLIELYKLKDLNESIFTNIVGQQRANDMFNGNLSIKGSTEGLPVFAPTHGSMFWNGILSNRSLPTMLKRNNYFINEYYNVPDDLYVCWVGHVILYQGPILEPYKEIPLVPIHANKKNQGFYGTMLTDSLVAYQEEYNEIRHQQRLISKLLGKPTLLVDDSKINSDYHPDKKIVLADISPFTTIHLNSQDNAMSEDIGVPISALNINYGTDNILEARKARLIAEMEKKYPNLKAIAMNSNPEMQREIIWSRDLNTNVILKELSLSFSQLAAKIFITRIFELKALAGDGVPIPSFENSDNSILLMIDDTLENSINTQKKVQKAFEQMYQQQVVKVAESIVKDGKTVPALKQQVIQQILQQVLEGVGKLGANPDEQSQVMEAAMQDPKIQQVVQELYQKEGVQKVQQIILEQAKSQVQMPVDNNFYLCLEDLDNIFKVQKEFEFSFKKSIKEQQTAMQTFLAMATPLQNLLPQIFSPKGFLEELCIMQGLDPNKIIRDKIPTPEDMIQQQNTKMYFGADKNPTIAADFYNKMRGEKVASKDSWMQDYQEQKQIDSQIAIFENQAKMEAKTKSKIAIEQAKPIQEPYSSVSKINGEMSNINQENNPNIGENNLQQNTSMQPLDQ